MFSGGLSIAWAFFASSILSFELAMHAWTKRRNAYSNAFFAVMLCAGLWSLFSGLHLVVEDFDIKVLISNIKFLFIAPLPVLWLLMAAWFTDFRIGKRMAAALFALPVLSLVLIATNGSHHLFFVSNEPFEMERFTTIAREYGPMFWVNMGYAYLMILGGFLLFLRKVVTSNGFVRVQALIMMVGSAFPLLFNVFYFLGPAAFLFLDWTPVSFAASGVFFFVGMFRYRMLDLIPIAQEQIIKAMDDGVIVTDPEGHILDMNDATGKLLEAERTRFTGKQILSVLPFIQPVWEAAGSNASIRMEVPRDSDGIRRWKAVRVKNVVNDAGVLQGKLILVRDVTERKEAELHLIESKRRIEELSKLKSAFLSNMSHDVRTPLSGIIGLADVLIEETEGDQRELATMIRTSGDRLLKLLNSILSVSHLASGTLDQHVEATDVVGLTQRILAQYERETEAKGLDLRVQLPDSPVKHELDPNHLGHALSHIMDQAGRFTESGSIDVEVRALEDGVRIRVSDTGRGFEPDFISSINEPLNTLSLAEFGLDKGSSLGLRVAHGLVAESGGQLVIQSQPGRGSTFTIRFVRTGGLSIQDRHVVPWQADPGRPTGRTTPSDPR
ncbi:MAG: ATP-binding protein [Bacteroidetes bacterium]|nr:ATP-binding protein [Bacteroidota bacterium]